MGSSQTWIQKQFISQERAPKIHLVTPFVVRGDFFLAFLSPEKNRRFVTACGKLKWPLFLVGMSLDLTKGRILQEIGPSATLLQAIGPFVVIHNLPSNLQTPKNGRTHTHKTICRHCACWEIVRTVVLEMFFFERASPFGHRDFRRHPQFATHTSTPKNRCTHTTISRPYD